ncbi:hypothetical protein ACFSHR_25580 [Azotobacter chroococcum]
MKRPGGHALGLGYQQNEGATSDTTPPARSAASAAPASGCWGRSTAATSPPSAFPA